MLKSAGPIFAARGFHGATVREICAPAGVNIASVGYYFGDKMGLYREVVRRIRDDKTRRFPIPDPKSHADPTERLFAFVRTLLQRMFDDKGDEGWQVRLLIREIQQPTDAMTDIVQDHFAPILEQLCSTLSEFTSGFVDPQAMKHLGLSVIGQCFHYRVSEHAIKALLCDHASPMGDFDIDALAIHITSVTLAAASNSEFARHQQQLRDLIPQQP